MILEALLAILKHSPKGRLLLSEQFATERAETEAALADALDDAKFYKQESDKWAIYYRDLKAEIASTKGGKG